MPTDDKLVLDVLEYLSELGEELPGMRGLWAHPLAVATCIDSKMDPARVRRLMERLLRADLVRDCDEPAEARNGRRGAPRRLFQITSAGHRALRKLKDGERVSFDAVYRGDRQRSLRASSTFGGTVEVGPVKVVPKLAAKVAPAKLASMPPGVNPFEVLYQAVEDYLEFAEPDMSEEYRVLEKACALVRAHRANTKRTTG